MSTDLGPGMSLLEKWSGPLAVGGLIAWWLVTPFMASIWVYEEGVIWADTTLLTRLFGSTLESAGLLAFGGEDVPYEVYGKGFVLVYLMGLPALVTFHRIQVASGRVRRAARWTFQVLFISAMIAMAGDFMSYWAVSIPGPVGEVLWGTGFGIEFMAVLPLLVATLVYGIMSIRIAVAPIWVSAFLVLALPIVIPTHLLTDYWPNALLLGVSVAWAVVGVWSSRHLATGHRTEARG